MQIRDLGFGDADLKWLGGHSGAPFLGKALSDQM
jgi:hypothetical protein